MVQHDQPFDDTYSKEIIGRIRELSPDLDEYVITRQYLLETQEENLSPRWLRNKLLTKLNDELNSSGIFINMDTDDMLEQPLFIEAMLTLKSKFSEENLFNFLKDHQDTRDDISELIADDCLDDIIECCARNFPLDEGWESLSTIMANRPGILRSTDNFNDLMKTVIERCERLGDSPIAQGSDVDKLLEYTGYLAKRKNKIVEIASVVYSADVEGNQNRDKEQILAEFMSRFETELSHPKTVRDYIDSSEDVKTFVNNKRQKYLTKWHHCFEYWIKTANKEAIPSELEAAVLVATLYVDALDPEHARVYVVETFENLIDQFGERYPIFRDIIDRALGNIVIVEGRVNHEIT